MRKTSNKSARKVHYFDVKGMILDKIKKNGGWANCHAHIDRAYTLTPALWKLANKFRHEKWKLNKEIRISSTVPQIYDRMAQATEVLMAQGVTAIGSFIDSDPDVKDKAIKAALKLRERYKSVTFKFMNQSSYGILKPEAREWFNIGADFADIIGGLLKADQGRENEHLDILLSTAKAKKKMLHVHVDELNTPEEKETEWLAKKTIEHGMEGRVVGVHAISLNAHPKAYREKVYKLMLKAKLMVVSNPISWLDARRNEVLAPVHNPIAPIDEMLALGIPVGIGVDNIADIFLGLNDADMWFDLKALIYENRLYDQLDEVVKIATSYGRKTLGIK